MGDNKEQKINPKPAPTDSSGERKGQRTPGTAEGDEKTVDKALQNDKEKK